MKKVLLLADDDIDDRELFCEALQSIDPSIVCHVAPDGKEVFRILSNDELEKPRLIFLDINMPGMDGWQCLSHLKQKSEHKDIPVLIYSTSSNQKDANTAIELGAMCFFAKPHSFSELKSILKVMVDNLDNKLLDAISHFNHIKSKKIFSCSGD